MGNAIGMRHKEQKLRFALSAILKKTNTKKIPHPYGTVSIRKGIQVVNIYDDKTIPSQLCKVSVVPDKSIIKKQLLSGVKIEGAELVTKEDTISIRVK